MKGKVHLAPHAGLLRGCYATPTRRSGALHGAAGVLVGRLAICRVEVAAGVALVNGALSAFAAVDDARLSAELPMIESGEAGAHTRQA